MQPRTDGLNYKQEALVEPDFCSGCGICLGSCNFDALSLQESPDVTLTAGKKDAWTLIVCSSQAKNIVPGAPTELGPDEDFELIELPCSGMVGPALAESIQKKGGRGMIVGTCPEGDCYYREGNIWLKERLNKTRKPIFRGSLEEFPVHVLAFNKVKRNTFYSEARNIMKVYPLAAPGDRIKRAFSYLKEGKPFFHYSGATLTLSLLLWIFYLGAVSGLGTPERNTAEAMIRVDFFQRTPQKDCNPQETNKAEYERVYQQNLERMTGTINMDMLNKEAREAILKRARVQAEQQARDKFCSRARMPIRLTIELDGERVGNRLYAPGGLQDDGITYVLYKEYIKPGEHTVRVLAERVSGKTKGDNAPEAPGTVKIPQDESGVKPGGEKQTPDTFELKFSRDFRGGRIYYVDYDDIKEKLYLRDVKYEK